MTESTTAVVHLVRAVNGPDPVRRFIGAYRRYEPRFAHSLVLALKGFGASNAAEVRGLWHGLNADEISVPDRGFDLGTYGEVASVLDHEIVCFLNSFSRPIAPAWLEKLVDAVTSGAGVAAATGSWESHATNAARIEGRASRWRRRGHVSREMYDFPSFPNPHVRTNAFAMRRALFVSLRRPAIQNKADAYQLESGADGISAQLRARGLPVVVVGADGHSYEAAEWPTCRTFRSGRQENLLVADNATDAYQHASGITRRRLRKAAWGDARSRA